MRSRYLVLMLAFAFIASVGFAQDNVVKTLNGRLDINPSALDQSVEPIIAINALGKPIVIVPDSFSGAALATATVEWLNQSDNLRELLAALDQWKKEFRPSAEHQDMITWLNNRTAQWLQGQPAGSTLTRAETIKKRALDFELSGDVLGSGDATTDSGTMFLEEGSESSETNVVNGCGPNGQQARKVYCCSWELPPCHFCDCSPNGSSCCIFGMVEFQQN